MDFIEQAHNQWESKQVTDKADREHKELLQAINQGQVTTVKAIAGLASVLLKHEGRVKVKNPVTSVATPDIQAVVDELHKLIEVESKEVDNTPVIEAINALIPVLQAIPTAIELPEAPEEVTISNLDQLQTTLNDILKTLKAVKVKEPDTITVTAPSVNVEAQDLKPLQEAFTKGLTKLEAAIKAIPVPIDDDSAVIDGLQAVRDQIAAIRFPVPNFITDPLVKFKAADEDAGGIIQYFGMVDNMGGWVILKRDTTSAVVTDRYANGSGGYPAKWTARASQTYDYLYQAING